MELAIIGRKGAQGFFRIRIMMFIGIYIWAALVSTEFRSGNCFTLMEQLSPPLPWKIGLVGFDRQLERDIDSLNDLSETTLSKLHPDVQWTIQPLGGGYSPAKVRWFEDKPTIEAQIYGFEPEFARSSWRMAYIESLILRKTPWGKAFRKLEADYFREKTFWNSWKWSKKIKTPKSRAAAFLYRIHRLSFINPSYKEIWDAFSAATARGDDSAAKNLIYDTFEIEPGLNTLDLEVEIKSYLIHPVN